MTLMALGGAQTIEKEEEKEKNQIENEREINLSMKFYSRLMLRLNIEYIK